MDPDIRLPTLEVPPETSAERVVQYLQQKGVIRSG
jgi:hypothetical protein